MDVQPLRRRIMALWIAALLALACSGAALAGTASTSHVATASGLAGKWTGSRLHGHITLSRPQGTYGISGSVSKGKIKFGAVSVGAKYKGHVRGTSMSGTWTSPQGGGSWSATKS